MQKELQRSNRMIKGISRQIIEIDRTENNYFEKAWLVIKPEYLNVGAAKLEKEAESYLKSIRPPYSIRSSKHWHNHLSNIGSAAIGAVITAAVLLNHAAF